MKKNIFTSIIISVSVTLLAAAPGFAQSDSITETFNGICKHTVTPYKNYIFSYTSETGIDWSVKTYYVPDAGGIDDEGNKVSGNDHCGSLFWTYGKSGYARATIEGGITTLAFDAMSGWFQKNGYVMILVDGIEIGRTNPITDQDMHNYTFVIDTPGPLDLELKHGMEGSNGGGILVDNLKLTSKEGTRPFIQVDKLEEYDPSMDTLKSVSDTMEIYYYAEGCLMVNGKFIDYFDGSETVEVIAGSVVDLNPGDSCNIYYWGSALPGPDTTGEDLPVGFYLPVNTSSDTVDFVSIGGGNQQEGMLSFINGNVDYDLVVFKITDLRHEYRIRFAFDHYPASVTGIQDNSYVPHVQFYPNPVRNHAWFRTGKELVSFEVLDLNGRILFAERNPVPASESTYKLDLEHLDAGIWIVRFQYIDKTMDAVKIMVE
jgi:hypothetical protein